MITRAGQVALTLRKELRETLRDRRTLAAMLLFPLVIYPLISLVVLQVATAKEKQKQERPSRVALTGPVELTGDLEIRLRADPTRFDVAAAGARADVESGAIDALVIATAARAPEESARVEIVYDATRDESRLAEERLSAVVSRIMPKGCVAQYAVARADTATRARLGGYLLAKILPIVIVLMVIVGAFYPAIDVTAGERERGTLETTFTAPVRRADLLLGKVLAVTAIASLTGALNLLSMSATLLHSFRVAAPELALDLPLGQTAAAALVILPAAFLFGAAFVAVGVLARGFKEAQNLLMPVYFLAFAPAMIATVGEWKLRGPAALLPGVNVTLLARDLVLGAAHAGSALWVLLSTLGFGYLALVAAARSFDSERVLESADPRPVAARLPHWRRWFPQAPRPDAPPSAHDALLLYAVGFVLFVFVFVPVQIRSVELGLLLAQWVGLLGLVAAYARATGRRLGDLLALRLPPAGALAGAVLVGCSGWVVVGGLTQWLAPPPKELLDEMRRTFVPADGSRALWETLVLVALSPAVCEEALFRGPILRGLATRTSTWAAAILCGVLFGLFHLDIHRLLPTSLLGVLLSLAALWTGSIVPAMIIHGLNNGILVVLAEQQPIGLEGELDALPPPIQLAAYGAAATMLAVGLRWLRGAGQRAVAGGAGNKGARAGERAPERSK